MATKLQLQLLNHIARSEYTEFNGARPDHPVSSYLFIDEVASDLNITIPQASGVVGSSVDGDLVSVGEGPDRDTTVIEMTDEGFAEWVSAYPTAESQNGPPKVFSTRRCGSCLSGVGQDDYHPADADVYVEGKIVADTNSGFVPFRAYLCHDHCEMYLQDGAEFPITRLLPGRQ